MKKLAIIIFSCLFLAACNNDSAGEEKKDTVNIHVGTQGNTDAGDTSSYDRMSNKITDSTDQ